MTKQELVSFINANYELAYSISDYTQQELENLLQGLEDEDSIFAMLDDLDDAVADMLVTAYNWSAGLWHKRNNKLVDTISVLSYN